MGNALSNSSTASVPTGAAVLVASTTLLLLGRYLYRQWYSPVVQCSLQCRCGKIQGHIKARPFDTIRLDCYCPDCQDYAHYIAHLGGAEGATTTKRTPSIRGSRGETKILQVCKSDIHISHGIEHLKLARKGPQEQSKQEGAYYMHRFYAGCCHMPLMNTIDFLGFVGVMVDALDADTVSKYYGTPVVSHPECALPTTTTSTMTEEEEKEQPMASTPRFLWNLLRYHPWRSAGSDFLKYDLEPVVYWGKDDDDDDDEKEEYDTKNKQKTQ